MNAPSGKFLVSLRVFSVVFALSLIGGYAVFAQKRAQRDAEGAAASSAPPAEWTIGEPRTSNGSAFVAPGSKSSTAPVWAVRAATAQAAAPLPQPVTATSLPNENSKSPVMMMGTKSGTLSIPVVPQASPTRAPSTSNIIMSGSKTYTGATQILQGTLTPQPAATPLPAPNQ